MSERPADPCRRVAGWLPLLAGAELHGEERRRAQRHLIGCPSCRATLAAHERALAALQSLAQHDPAPSRPTVLSLTGAAPEAVPTAIDSVPAPAGSLWPALARQIEESRRPGGSPWAERPGHRPWRWALAGLAAGVLLLGGSSWLWSLSRQYQLKVSLVPVARPVSPPSYQGPLTSGSDLPRFAPPAYRRPIDGTEPPATIAIAEPSDLASPTAESSSPATPTN